ncbi:MAG: alpha/beta fold hydrolase [Pseudomonadota bacterium]
MRTEAIEFIGSQGTLLAARLDLPDGPPLSYALFAHCFTCTKDIFAATQICSELTRHGIAVLRFDFSGLGHSEGDFSNTNFSSNLDDLVAAASWLKQEYEAPRLLIGHSLGGAAVLASAHRLPEVKAVATIAAPSEPSHIAKQFTAVTAEIEMHGEAEVYLAGRPFRIKKQFLEDIAKHTLADRIAHLNRALIVFHAPGDTIVGIKNAGQIFSAAKHPKSFISLDHADHLLRRRQDADYVAQVLAAWVTRYL